MSKVKQKTNWKRTAYITLIWLIISVFQTLYEHLIFAVHEVPNRAEFQQHNLLLTNILAGLIAGLYNGEAMVGELGKVKRDIYYSDDVLTTTARIQGECNSKGVELLISDKLQQALPSNGKFAFRKKGRFKAAGKNGTRAGDDSASFLNRG